jgi:hypothetical protein
MFSSIRSLFAAAALLAILPSSLAQTSPVPTGDATVDQKRISQCQASIQTPGFNFEYNYDVNDQSQYSITYIYSYEGELNIGFLHTRFDC